MAVIVQRRPLASLAGIFRGGIILLRYYLGVGWKWRRRLYFAEVLLRIPLMKRQRSGAVRQGMSGRGEATSAKGVFLSVRGRSFPAASRCVQHRKRHVARRVAFGGLYGMRNIVGGIASGNHRLASAPASVCSK